ncbi:MAG: EamA family transporter, partial [Pseudomonadota bacterium]
VAATLGATQALAVIFLARIALGTPIRVLSVTAAVLGIFGVGVLILNPNATLDPIGVIAGVAGALSMAAGTVLTRKWRPPVSLLTFTAWQLTAGGLLLVPLAMLFEPALPPLSLSNIAGFTYLALNGAALTYVLWFRGIARLEPSVISTLGFLSPLSAVVLGWAFLGQALSMGQLIGAAVIIGSVWLSQRSVQPEVQVVPAPFRSTKTRRLAFLSRIKALINGAKSYSPLVKSRNIHGVEQ